MMDPTDGDLVLAALGGRTEAFRVLVDRYGGAVASYLRARRVPATDLEDLAQDVFVKAYQALGALEDRGSFAGWLFAIARNLALDCLRKATRRGTLVGPAAIESISDPRPGPASATLAEERRERMRLAIADLPEVFRTTLHLKHQKGLTAAEIGRLQGVGVGTVTKRLSRAYERLRRAFEAEGVGES